MMPSGVQATSVGRFWTSRPTFSGWNPSTSLSGSIASKTTCSAVGPSPDGSGDCTRIPSQSGLVLRSDTIASTSSSPEVAGSRNRSARRPDSPADFSLFRT